MSYKLEIETGNAAFCDEDGNPDPAYVEIIRLLKVAIGGLEEGRHTLHLRDVNGNPVGSSGLEEDSHG